MEGGEAGAELCSGAERIMRPLNDVHDNILYTETGQIWCRCPVSGKERRNYGLEEERGSLKYRCLCTILTARGGTSVTVTLAERLMVTAEWRGCVLTVAVLSRAGGQPAVAQGLQYAKLV